MTLKAPKSRTTTRKPVQDKPPKTNVTMLATLSMFNEGMSITEIAEQRRLSETTVEAHLGALVKDGSLSISRVIAPNRLDGILEGIRQSGQVVVLKPIKDILGDNYSYGEIRMALEYYNMSQK